MVGPYNGKFRLENFRILEFSKVLRLGLENCRIFHLLENFVEIFQPKFSIVRTSLTREPDYRIISETASI